MDLLEKASIILTPTAYNNGEALCVKPSDGSGDFDFSRNSAATRVNAQGLVENVQILSSNLVQNGDFSEEGAEEVSNGSFSQEGAELVTNGNFDTDSDWNKGAGWSISGGKAILTNNSGSLSKTDNILEVGKTYLFSIEITSISLGAFSPKTNTGQNIFDSVTINTVGVHTAYFTVTSGTNLQIRASGTTTGSIDNVSIREVGQDWTFGTGWSVGDGVAISDGSNGYSFLQQTGAVENGKSYKLTYSVTNYVSGTIEVGVGGASNNNIQRNSVGDFVEYHTSNGTNLTVISRNFNGSVTNISVKEVGQNWTLETGWEIGNNVANATNAPFGSQLFDSTTLTANKKYSVSFVISNYIQGSVRVAVGNVFSDVVSADGSYTFILTSANTNAFKVQAFSGGSGTTLSITNISVIEITDDTNLPRINYENFSFQDALGSELVVNGGFDTDSDWDLGTGWSIGGGEAVALNSASGQRLSQDNILQVGKIYKLTYEVKSISSGGFKAFVGGVALQQISNIGVYTETMTTPTINDDFFIRTLGTTSGSIDNVSVKEYLGQEVVPDSGCGSWLFEPQSTNTVNNSNFTGAMGYHGGLIRSNDAAISPDGTFNAMSFIPTAAGGIHRTGYSLTAGSYSQNDIVTFSCFVKANGYNFVTVGGFFGQEKAVFNISNGTLVSQESNVINTEIVKLTNDWYRLSTTYTFQNSIGNGYLYAGIYVMETETGYAFTGDGVSGVYGYGFQAELGTGTSYIPTEGTSVTRNQDVCNNGGSLASINSTEGVLYAEIAALADDNSYRLISLTQGTNGGNRLYLGFANTSNQIRVRITSGGATQVDITQSLSNIKDFNKIAFKYKENDFALWVNGIKVATDTNGLTAIGLNNLSFETGSSLFFGKTKALALFPYLSDEELTELTTI